MFSKNSLAVLLVVAVAVHAGHHEENHKSHHPESPKLESHGHEHYNHEEHHDHPKYKFEYSVEDHKTGDIKSHSESRDGDLVHGYYTLVESDGTTRVVHYTADKHNGFNAVVKKIGKSQHPEVLHHEHHQKGEHGHPEVHQHKDHQHEGHHGSHYGW